MTDLIDLTLTLGSDRVAPVPGLVGVSMEPLHTHETHARSNTKLTLATHLGTHVDAPYHFHPDGITVDNMPLNRYMGPAKLLDLRELAKGQSAISISDLQQAGADPEALRGQIAVLFTEWAA
ncbi:MAG: cyclase family protein, partial [Chloroflexi bacterium]|nr:cyclase family protein [Chloroflexota bacterium]